MTDTHPGKSPRTTVMADLVDVGKLLRAARMRRGMGQGEAAKRLGFTEYTLYCLERGRVTYLKKLIDYARLMGATLRITIYLPVERIDDGN